MYKKRIISFLGFRKVLYAILIFGHVACSDELDILTTSESIPVVYCIMNPQDSIYKILLTRTFSGNKSASDLAQDTALISYQRAKVTMEAWSNGYLVWETAFTKMPINRDSGLFSSEPGCAFETKNVLSKTFGYQSVEHIQLLFDYLRIVVDYQDNHEPAFARIKAYTGKPEILYPIYSYKGFNLYDSIPYRLVFTSSDKLYYDLRCKFHYQEVSQAVTDRILDFSIQPNINTISGTKLFYVRPDNFFRRLAEAFKSETSPSEKKFISLDLELQVGSPSLRLYLDNYNTDNDQGYKLWNCFHNGIGLFALKSYSSLANLHMDQRTLDSLAWGRYTKDLKFNRW